jgi:type IV secretory pathway TraG/TraD family ATPase VirD4
VTIVEERWADVLKAVMAASAVLLLTFLVGLFWLAGQLSGVLSGQGWPDSSPIDVFGILVGLVRSGGNPTLAWQSFAGASIGPSWLVYLLFVLMVTPTPYVAYRLVRLLRNLRRRPESRRWRLGFASQAEVRRLMTASVVQSKAKVVRPSMAGRKNVDPREVAFFLGRDVRSRQELYASVEDVFIVLAPPRQGKDVHFCAPFTIDAPGACIVTSTRADAFTNTVSSRREHGKIYVFDPNGLTNWPDRMRWSPIRGCEDPLTAANRSASFVTGSGFKMGGEGAYWVGVAITILRCYLHAAALADKSMLDVMKWSTQPSNPQPLTILRTAEAEGRAAQGWAGELEACASAEPKFRATMWATLAQAMSCFSDPAVLDICSPSPEEVFDLRSFLSGRNTLYVLGKEKPNGSVAPVVTAMMEDLFDGARKIASRMPGSRMDPPLTVELNEAAHIAPLPSLPSYMGDSGGFSIALHVYLQSLSQARSKWGNHEAMIMWDNAAVRIIMGGAGNVDDLEDISRLMGETRERQTTRTSGPDGDGRSVSKLKRRVLSPEEIRTLRFGRAVVVARAARPIEISLTPWWKRKDGDQIAAGKANIEKLILQYSEAAERVSPHMMSSSAEAVPTPTPPLVSNPASLTDDLEPAWMAVVPAPSQPIEPVSPEPTPTSVEPPPPAPEPSTRTVFAPPVAPAAVSAARSASPAQPEPATATASHGAADQDAVSQPRRKESAAAWRAANEHQSNRPEGRRGNREQETN